MPALKINQLDRNPSAVSILYAENLRIASYYKTKYESIA